MSRLLSFALRGLTLAGIVWAPDVAAQGSSAQDPASLLFLQIPTVRGASQFDQPATEAPSAVTVITAEEISRYGWRTLAEVVGSVRGFYTTYDRAYTYVGVRGFGRPSDYSNRLLLVVDGHAVNDPIYGGSAYGTESIVDVTEIERVEFIRGPGSSLYGANAFFGVINVITRRGRDITGGRVRAGAGSLATRSLETRYARRFGSGMEIFASGQVYRRNGEQQFYPEYDSPDSHDGIAEFDRDGREHALLKVSRGNFNFEAAYNNRSKQVPTGSYGTLFNDERSRIRDAEAFVAAEWDQTRADGTRNLAAIGLFGYDYRGGFPLAEGLYDDASRGRWMSLQVSTLRPLGDNQKLMVGGEYRLSFTQSQSSGPDSGPLTGFSNDTPNDIWALYVQDELRVGGVLFNAGLRLDHYQTFGANLSPRAAVVVPWQGGALKFLHGRAFRPPSNFELFYEDGYSVKASPHLHPERIATSEIVLEQRLTRGLFGMVSGYDYRATELIDQVYDSSDGLVSYANTSQARGQGIEAELDLDTPVLQGSLSYALQQTRDRNGNGLTNSPAHLMQLAVSRYLIPNRLTAAFRVQGMSSRSTSAKTVTPGYLFGTLTIRGRKLWSGLGASIEIYNLWNTRFSDPVGEEHRQVTIRQDGRQVRFTAAWEF